MRPSSKSQSSSSQRHLSHIPPAAHAKPDNDIYLHPDNVYNLPHAGPQRMSIIRTPASHSRVTALMAEEPCLQSTEHAYGYTGSSRIPDDDQEPARSRRGKSGRSRASTVREGKANITGFPLSCSEYSSTSTCSRNDEMVGASSRHSIAGSKRHSRAATIVEIEPKGVYKGTTRRPEGYGMDPRVRGEEVRPMGTLHSAKGGCMREIDELTDRLVRTGMSGRGGLRR